MEYKNYRIKSPVKSFRDLEVYQKTIQLSNEFTSLKFLSDSERKDISEIVERIPMLIAESYGDKYESVKLAYEKLTEALTLITRIITKIDLLRERFKEKGEKEVLDKLLTNYRTQRIKILNLRKAWNKVYSQNSQSKNE